MMSAMAGANPIATATANKRKNSASGFEYHRSPIGGPSINVDGASLPDLSVYKKGIGVDAAISSMTPAMSIHGA
jgi:hypothetical protein